MADKNIHNEIKNWKKLQNLIDLYKFKISHTFPILYWSIGIFSTVMLLFIQSDKIILFLRNKLFSGDILWAIITIIFTILLIFSIWMLNKVHKSSADNLEYLYRKLDGQEV